MTIYIAGKFTSQDRLRVMRDQIHAAGLGVVQSRWLDEREDLSSISAIVSAAQRDLDDVLLADLLIFDSEGETRRGGRETELGIALGRGTEVWRVGPLWCATDNIFNLLVPYYRTWQDVIEELHDRKCESDRSESRTPSLFPASS
jgi:hypothetical protein